MEGNAIYQQETVAVTLCDGRCHQAPRVIQNRHGQHYQFKRPVMRRYQDLCLDNLAADEVALDPGLIYQLMSEV
ncbi:hypothetical protein [Shewanella algae]